MKKSFTLLLFVAASALGAPAITSVTPNNGGLSGGTLVTIKGSGFSVCTICSPPAGAPVVTFGGVSASSVQLVDGQTLIAISPAHPAATVDVAVGQFDGNAIAINAFTYTTNPDSDVETILLPIFMQPVHGAFGSLFVTDARAHAISESPVTVSGLCGSLATVIPGGTELALDTSCASDVGRLLLVPKAMASNITFNDRVTDTTRTSSSLGTEIPVIRSSRMTTSTITLVNVPIDARYRKTLRIYALEPITVFVTTVGSPFPVTLQRGPSGFDPAYAQYTDFPIPVDNTSSAPITVTIEEKAGDVGLTPFWAFITVTNNETQQITTITPDF